MGKALVPMDNGAVVLSDFTPENEVPISVKTPEGIFAQGFGFLAKYPMIDPDLPIESKSLYALICSYIDQTGSSRTFLTVVKICDFLQIAPHSFYKYLEKLVTNGYITISKRTSSVSNFPINEYFVQPFPPKFRANRPDGKHKKEYKQIRDAKSIRAAGYGLIPKLPLLVPNVGIKAKGLYAYLVTYLDRDSHTVWPSQQQIMTDLNVSAPVLRAAFKELVSASLLLKGSQFREGGKFSSQPYKIATDPQLPPAVIESQKVTEEAMKERQVKTATKREKAESATAYGILPRGDFCKSKESVSGDLPCGDFCKNKESVSGNLPCGDFCNIDGATGETSEDMAKPMQDKGNPLLSDAEISPPPEGNLPDAGLLPHGNLPCSDLPYAGICNHKNTIHTKYHSPLNSIYLSNNGNSEKNEQQTSEAIDEIDRSAYVLSKRLITDEDELWQMIEEAHNIPFEFLSNFPQLDIAVKFLTAYDRFKKPIYHNGNALMAQAYTAAVKALEDMLDPNESTFRANYYKVWTRLEDAIDFDDYYEPSLVEFIKACAENYVGAIQRAKVTRPSQYMKEVVWSVMMDSGISDQSSWEHDFHDN